MKTRIAKIAIWFYIVFFVAPSVTAVSAAILQFDPTSISAGVSAAFEVKLYVDSKGEEINSVDSFILYDSTLLEVQAVNPGSFFPTVLQDLTKAGTVYVAGMVDFPGTFKIGAGSYASVVFKTKKTGTGTLTFKCTDGSTTDSNVVKNDVNATDIIECASNGKTTITVGTSGGVTPTATSGTTGGITPTTTGGTTTTTGQATSTPTKTPTPTKTKTPTPTTVITIEKLPQSGVGENIVGVVGGTLFVIGALAIIFL
ncbi:MAG TPA: hypothetical protein VJH96_04155 [Patescibacteria group bacterium]|nr:hypothetical protein [Patescibacteria group bacterium]